MGVLICKTIALFHCVSFDRFIELQVFHKVAWTSIICMKKNGYPSTKKRQTDPLIIKKGEEKQESYTVHVQAILSVCIYYKDKT